MKKLLLGFCGVLILSGVGTVSSASAKDWPWHRHHKDAASATPKQPKQPKQQKARKSFLHHEKASKNNGDPVMLSSGPKSVGRRHPQPGPAGAGAS
jgi:hypothetical protein